MTDQVADAGANQTSAPSQGAGASAPAGDQVTQQTQTLVTGDQPAAADATQQAQGNGTAEANTKPEGDQAKPEGAPEKYEFKAPEGVKFDESVMSDFSEVAKELNLTQDAAQKIVDKMMPRINAQSQEAFQKVNAEWVNASRADKEFGGDKLNENLAVAKKALDAYATPELRTLLDRTGMGNNPELIRMFYRVGKAMSEDGFVPGSTAPNKGATRDAATALYGSTH